MENNNFTKTITVTLLVFGVIFTMIGGTFAYFSASVNSNANDVSGKTYKFDVTLNITSVKSGNLIPLDDNLIDDTLNSTHVCTDTRGYGLCSLYKLTLNNTGEAQTMTGYLTTVSTTYTTSNLKYQLFTKSGNTYTAVSDMKSLPIVTNATSDFTMSASNINVTMNDGTSSAYSVDYYLAMWISDPGTNQLDDSNRTYNGKITFVSTRGESISANFS